MQHKDALAIANRLVESLRPHCERVEIAGSLRRGKPEVRDIELVAIPRHTLVVRDTTLFGDITEERNLAHGWATKHAPSLGVRWIKPGTDKIEDWPPRPEAKYLRALVSTEGAPEIKLDLFFCRPENWGITFLVRTGSKDFSAAIATHARDIGRPMAGGSLTRDGQDIATPEERDVFEILNIPWIPPEKRISKVWRFN